MDLVQLLVHDVQVVKLFERKDTLIQNQVLGLRYIDSFNLKCLRLFLGLVEELLPVLALDKVEPLSNGFSFDHYLLEP